LKPSIFCSGLRRRVRRSLYSSSPSSPPPLITFLIFLRCRRNLVVSWFQLTVLIMPVGQVVLPLSCGGGPPPFLAPPPLISMTGRRFTFFQALWGRRLISFCRDRLRESEIRTFSLRARRMCLGFLWKIPSGQPTPYCFFSCHPIGNLCAQGAGSTPWLCSLLDKQCCFSARRLTLSCHVA